MKELKGCNENVLVLQGGGSLGAYECGVFKAIHKLKIKIDVIAGTSIGGINAAIIAASKDDEPAKNLEDFWMNISENVTLPFVSDKIREITASAYSAWWGNQNAFFPLWQRPQIGFPFNAPYLYDISPMKKTIEKYVDYTKLKDSKRPRLIITSTDIQNGKPSIFDSKYDGFTSDNVLAGAGYPFYGISWTKVGSRYLWDGTLLSNTPLREAIAASPICDKNVIMVSLFPRNQEELPKNMLESWHRARDIMHTDKTDESLRQSKVISRYVKIIKEMYDILESIPLNQEDKDRLDKIMPEYEKLASERGAIIKEIAKIERKEKSHYLFEDADFSANTIKNLIKSGERDGLDTLSPIVNNFNK